MFSCIIQPPLHRISTLVPAFGRKNVYLLHSTPETLRCVVLIACFATLLYLSNGLVDMKITLYTGHDRERVEVRGLVTSVVHHVRSAWRDSLVLFFWLDVSR